VLDEEIPSTGRVVGRSVRLDVLAIASRAATAPGLRERSHHAEPDDAAIFVVEVLEAFELGQLGYRIIGGANLRSERIPAQTLECTPRAEVVIGIHVDVV
jgi:hypothetical protein